MRADLGLMLMHEPEILFLDEPTIGVDVLARRNILDFIKNLNREQGVTVMITSHDMDELEQLAGRIVMIDRGRIAFDGPFDELRNHFGDRRRLRLQTSGEEAPDLNRAELMQTEAGWHEYVFDAEQVKLPALLAEASAQASVLDAETHRAPIDEVIADIYAEWET